jgi:hypothetical protein
MKKAPRVHLDMRTGIRVAIPAGVQIPTQDELTNGTRPLPAWMTPTPVHADPCDACPATSGDECMKCRKRNDRG